MLGRFDRIALVLSFFKRLEQLGLASPPRLIRVERTQGWQWFLELECHEKPIEIAFEDRDDVVDMYVRRIPLSSYPEQSFRRLEDVIKEVATFLFSCFDKKKTSWNGKVFAVEDALESAKKLSEPDELHVYMMLIRLYFKGKRENMERWYLPKDGENIPERIFFASGPVTTLKTRKVKK